MTYPALVITGWRGQRASPGQTRWLYGLHPAYADLVKAQLMHAVGALLEPAGAIHVGDAPGVDDLARRAIMASSRALQIHHAAWDKHGNRAGPMRNAAMLEAAGPEALVLAFPHAESRGTADCIKQAMRRGMDVRIYPLDPRRIPPG